MKPVNAPTDQDLKLPHTIEWDFSHRGFYFCVSYNNGKISQYWYSKIHIHKDHFLKSLTEKDFEYDDDGEMYADGTEAKKIYSALKPENLDHVSISYDFGGNGEIAVMWINKQYYDPRATFPNATASFIPEALTLSKVVEDTKKMIDTLLDQKLIKKSEKEIENV